MVARAAAELDASTVRERLSQRSPESAPSKGLQPSAVLVPLVPGPEGLELILTLRPTTLASHAGQVSFPGGRVDPADGDDRWATALREAHEEIDLDPEAVEPLGRLDDYPTITRYHVTPWVGLVDPAARLTPFPSEVADLFRVPLAHLADPERRRTMRLSRREHHERVHFYLVRPHTVWGVTAAIVTHLLEVLGVGPARGVAQATGGPNSQVPKRPW